MTSAMARIGSACALALAFFLTPAAARAGALPETVVPLNCGVQLKNHNFSREDLQRVRETGIRVIRKGVYWNTVESQKGVYDFSEYDRLMDDAEELGLTVVGCLFGNNKAYEEDGVLAIRTEAGRKGFAAFAAAMAERYKDRDVVWEVWNEPNIRTFWRKDGTHNSEPYAIEYTALVKEVVPAMLAADPDAFVMAGSVSNYWQPSYEWTEYCLRHGILDSGIRGWSVHPYGVKTPEEAAIGHERMRELLTQYGASEDFPIINSERGFALQKTEHEMGAEGWSGGAADRVAQYQGWHFVRQYMIDQMYGVKFTIWYEWSGKEGFSLYTGDPKHPAHQAAKVMIQQLDGFRYVRRLETDSKLDYVLLFENSDGERKLVAWTAPPAGGAPDEAREHGLTIEIGQQPRFDTVQLDGAASQTPATLFLMLSGAPQYVAVPRGVELGKGKALHPARTPQPAAAPEPISGAHDLKLFDSGSEWEFIPNTGEGAFTLSTDNGRPIGVMQYDFSRSTSHSHPYVLAMAPVSVPEGAAALVIHARSDIGQQLTFRVIDSTGQTHQFKSRIRGTGGWEAVRIPLNRRLEHWDGANDGTIHFPIRHILFSVPKPSDDHPSGKVEYTDAVAVGADS